MEFQEIEVVIAADGKVKIQVQGVRGTQCLDLTKDLEAALGGQIASREMSHEAYDSASTQEQDYDWSSTKG